MKHSTAFADKFAAKGITANIVRLTVAMAEFRNNGGSCRELLEQAASACADQPDEVIEFAARTMRSVQLRNGGEEGQLADAEKAVRMAPSSPSPQRSAGHVSVADKAR